MSLAPLYIRSSLFSAFGKLAGAASGLALIWLITAIGGKNVFGEIMVAYAACFILAGAVAGQFQSLVLYHVSRNAKQMPKTGAALVWAGITGLLIAVAMQFLPQPWFASMSWMIPAFAVNSVLCTYHRAKQDVGTMVMHFEVWPQILRCAFLAVILLTTKDATLIPHTYTVSYLVSFLALYIRKPISLAFNPRHFTKWDMSYSFQMMVSQLLSKSLNNIVIFVLGMFATPAIVADYTLAMRFAQFLQLPKLILAQIHVPRMGTQIESKAFSELLTEFNAVRIISLAATILGTAFFLLFMPYIFIFFPDFLDAYDIFIVLALGAIVLAAFGNVGNYIGIAGYGRENLLTNAIGLVILLGALAILAPLGGVGAAWATVIGGFSLMALMTLVIYRKDNLNTVAGSALFQLFASFCILTGASLNIFIGPAAALLLIAVAGMGLIEARPALKLLLPS